MGPLVKMSTFAIKNECHYNHLLGDFLGTFNIKIMPKPSILIIDDNLIEWWNNCD